jgi:hypothetical protein
VTGIEIIPARQFLEEPIIQQIDTLGPGWIRLNEISWQAVQPEPDTPPDQWNWRALARFEQQVLTANALGIRPIVVVDDQPLWARSYPEASCSAIVSEHFETFARFMEVIVARYSRPPYNVRYWEIMNEPDVDPRLMFPEDFPFFGCWGDIDDPYYGGEHYGRMLLTVGPAIKQADPDAQIISGGLLLDRPFTDNGFGRPELFLEGAIRAGGGAYIDIVAFHAYGAYRRDVGRVYDSDLKDGRWEEMGGMIDGKARYLRDMLARYGLQKPLMITEASLMLIEPIEELSDEEVVNFFEAQADHAVRIMARSMEEDIESVCWYTFNGPGWRNTALLDAEQLPRPSYRALEVFVQQAESNTDTIDMSFLYGEPFEAYRFLDVNGRYHVDIIWATQNDETLTIGPDNFIRATTRDGAPLEPFEEPDGALTLPVGVEPIYIFWER